MIKYEVKTKDTLLKSLSSETKLPFSVINKKLREKQVLVNNERVKINVNVNCGDEIVIFAKEVAVSFKTVFIDENILIIVKPAGIETTGENSAESILKSQKYNFVKACHRLDRNTEGLVVFALNENSYNLLLKAFKNDEVKKEYIAQVFGKPMPEFSDVAYLKKNEIAATVMIFRTKVAGSVQIKTKYKKLRTNGEISTLKVFLDNGGKTHQIRAHLASLGLFLVGDGKYGNSELNKKYKQKTQQLFATKIIFNLKNELKYLNDLDITYEPVLKF